MPSTATKATFSLPAEVLAALDEAVARKAAPSRNAFVRRALLRELRDLRGERRIQWEEAMRDPLFLRDLEEVQAAFRLADAETARGIV